jgi:hypothetical protein
MMVKAGLSVSKEVKEGTRRRVPLRARKLLR